VNKARVRLAAAAWLMAFECASLFGASLRVVDAVKDQDRAALRTLLASHADVNAGQGDGATALHWAAHWNDPETASLLIKAGAKVNAADDQGVTPLSLACLNANAPLVESLLNAGANPNLSHVSGETPLMTAALTGSVDVVKLLLSHGAQVNAYESSRGQTALMRAVAAHHSDVAAALIAAGADVKARSANRFTALLFAAQQGDVASAGILLEAGADVRDTAPDGVGGDTNARTMFKPDTDAGTLLVAIDSHHEEIARFLMEHGADVNQNGAGRTPLHSAVQQAMAGTVKDLLAHGANPNVRLEKRLPLLSRFILQDSGIEVDPLGATPFWLASSFANLEIMKLLAAGGADLKLASKMVRRPCWSPPESISSMARINMDAAGSVNPHRCKWPLLRQSSSVSTPATTSMPPMQTDKQCCTVRHISGPSRWFSFW
jgi:ankyrin repeat protein